MTFKTSNISITVEKDVIFILQSILQRGFFLRIRAGYSIRDFLYKECKIDKKYIDEKIKTIFLNSKPVDDIDKAIVRDGSTLAVSGAMPGLVGALMRSGSFYSSLRSSITHREDKDDLPEQGTCMVRLRLFNVLMTDLGPGFFKRGIFLLTTDLADFFSGQPVDFWQGCREILLNGEPTGIDIIKEGQFSFQGEYILLKVKTGT